MKEHYIKFIIFVATVALLLPSCDNNEKIYNSALLPGEWQLYATASANEQWSTYEGKDPILSVEFYQSWIIRNFEKSLDYGTAIEWISIKISK